MSLGKYLFDLIHRIGDMGYGLDQFRQRRENAKINEKHWKKYTGRAEREF